MFDQQAADGADGASGATSEGPGLTQDEAHLYATLSRARLDADRVGTALPVLHADELATATRALEDLAMLRAVTAGAIPDALSPDDAAHLTLGDAIDSVRMHVIAIASGANLLNADAAHTLGTLTAALERMHRLDATPAQRSDAQLEQLAADVVTLLDAIQESGITREHLSGRLEALRRPLETLETDLHRIERG